MLRNIPKIIPPELVKTMMEMGHSDVLIIADANFPGTAHAKKIIRMDGIMIPELLEAVLQLFPLDNFIENPVRLMRNLKDDAFHDFEFIDRLPFYKTAEEAFVIVQTGDESRYGNIILQKGVC